MEFTTLPQWYAENGRHELPWRHAINPWRVLVSELMLQQTPVTRVIGHYDIFIDRWPSPEALALSPLDEVLRAWQGLGYPRRARALWQSARAIAGSGWPQREAELRELPGVGSYTARAMIWICQWDDPASPPRDVNLGRIAARTHHGTEPQQQSAAALDLVLARARPAAMARRDYVYSLFDVGASHCRATPLCSGCPLASNCSWRNAPPAASPPPRRQAAYSGSLRQLRGRLLRLALSASDDLSRDQLLAEPGLMGWPGATVTDALDTLLGEGLLSQRWQQTAATAAPVAP